MIAVSRGIVLNAAEIFGELHGVFINGYWPVFLRFLSYRYKRINDASK